MTLEEQLEQINKAIAAIEGGAQEYRIGSRQLRRPDLAVLYKERRLLLQQIRDESGGNIYVATFNRR